MPLFTVEEVLTITGARLLSGAPRTSIRRLCTDSRSVRPGDLFVALTGDRFDGHEFVADAVRQGAVGALVNTSFKPPGLRKPARPGHRRAAEPLMFAVPDPLVAYQDLAAYHRSRFGLPVVAVTGSNGKTSTKEMTAKVLAERGRTLKTEGNLNNRIGVPQTLLRLTARHEAAVVEMGVDQKGQTTRLAQIARPTAGIITNIGPDHLEFFGSIQASADAKAELLDLLPQDGAAILNADDDYFDRLASRARCRVVSFGMGRRAQVRATEAVAGRRGTTFRLILPGVSSRPRVMLPAYGAHNVSNALAAAAVGHVLKVSAAGIVRGLGRFRPVAMRSQVSTHRGIRIINDCYNANPASMKAAIDLLTDLGAGRRTIAVLGDMLELGPTALALHRDIGAYLRARGVSRLVACGAFAAGIAEGARAAGMPEAHIQQVAEARAAAAALRSIVRTGDVVLVKASRGMRMEQVIGSLVGQSGPEH